MINIENYIHKLHIIKKIIFWKIDGQYVHGIKPNTQLSLTAYNISRLYNVPYSW